MSVASARQPSAEDLSGEMVLDMEMIPRGVLASCHSRVTRMSNKRKGK